MKTKSPKNCTTFRFHSLTALIHTEVDGSGTLGVEML
jgi:hypothetical protein